MNLEMSTNNRQITDLKKLQDEFTLNFIPRSLILFTHFALLAKQHSENHLNTKNKSKMKSLGTGLTVILLLSFGLRAQSQEESQETKTRPFQMTFVTPLGTNGLDAWNITNKFSINLYAGYNGGLDGIELSGFGGMLKNDMEGTQIAGFGNIVMHTGNGFQAAGFFNFTKLRFEGLQIAGFANIIASDAKAWQLSGFGNVTTQQLDGGQIAGFANYSKGNTIGQASGFANVNHGDLKGFQLAGFTNVNTESVEGAQIAGFANYTRKLKGVQIAPFNYVDSLEKGLPIGVFSIVKNGYRAFEISANETLYGVASFKTGTEKFYNIISVGASYKNEMILWGWGYGIGTFIQFKNNWGLAIELLSYQINEDEWFTEAMNLNNKLQITTSKKVSENMDVFGGLSWNVNVSKTLDHNQNAFESSITPYHVFNKTYGNDNNVKMYPGFTAGIRF
ncbi:MAG TPA: hypothetical protein DCG75_13095 [Bacteroidales bacterium]|nr:hypothetical protein [Bacteroidales bacterium]